MKEITTIKNATIGLLISLTASTSFADNTLKLGDGVNLIVVNGSEINSDRLFGGSSEHKLPNGLNQIMVDYTAEVKKGSETELEHSNAFVLLFEAKDQNLVLNAPEIKKLKDIKALEDEKNWSLMNSQGQPVTYKVSLIKREGFQLSRDYEGEIEDLNNTDAEAALPKSAIFHPNALVSKANKTNNNNKADSKDNMPAQMLIFWYNQADEATRKSFKELINNQ